MRFRLQMADNDEVIQPSIPLYKTINNSIWEYPSFISTATRPPYDDEYLGPSEVCFLICNFGLFYISLLIKLWIYGYWGRYILRGFPFCVFSLKSSSDYNFFQK